MTSQQDELPGHEWKHPQMVAEYIERVDRQEAERAAVFGLMARLVPAETDAPILVLDIGAGHGPVITAVLDEFPNAHGLGLDISDAMMEAGQERMARFGDRFEYIVGDFSDGLLPANVVAAGPYDVVVSSRAIHHLTAALMEKMYADVYKNLKPGGAFFNVDTASPNNPELQEIYRGVSRAENADRPAVDQTSPARMAHNQLHHHRDATLVKHIEWLTAAGFHSVDAHYKRLGLALLGGYKK